MLPVILILLLPCIALASTATRATPEQLRKCKFQQPWSFLDCYHEKSDFPTYWIVIVGIINILSCTFFSITIYPTFNFGWNSPNALGYPQEPDEHIPLQHIQQPLALVEYENEPQPSLPPAISYFNLTGGDDWNTHHLQFRRGSAWYGRPRLRTATRPTTHPPAAGTRDQRAQRCHPNSPMQKRHILLGKTSQDILLDHRYWPSPLLRTWPPTTKIYMHGGNHPYSYHSAKWRY